MMMRFALLAAALLACILSPVEAGATPFECRDDAETVLALIDRTTGYDTRDLEALDKGLQKVILGIETGDRLVVRTITDDALASAEIFTGCLPGCDDGFLGFFNCSQSRTRAARQAFYGDVMGALRKTLSPTEDYPHSDIARTIVETVRVATPVKHLAVFSDLIENSEIMPWATLLKVSPAKALDTMRSAGATTDLGDAKVTVWGVGRSHGVPRKSLPVKQRQALDAFWRAWFLEAGVSTPSIGYDYPLGR